MSEVSLGSVPMKYRRRRLADTKFSAARRDWLKALAVAFTCSSVYYYRCAKCYLNMLATHHALSLLRMTRQAYILFGLKYSYL
jgi:hypothetical protein